MRTEWTTEEAVVAAGAQGAIRRYHFASVLLRLAWRSCDKIGHSGV